MKYVASKHSFHINGAASASVTVGGTATLDVIRPGGSLGDVAIMVKNNGSGTGLRIQTYDLTADPNAYMGLGTDMGGNPYEHSLVFSYGSSNQGRQTFGTFNGTTYSTKMTILGTGNVGIGTTSPSYPLHVATAVASGTIAGKYFNYGSGLTLSTQSYNTSIYAAGGVATSDVFVAFSDARAKIHEEPPVEPYLNFVDKIQVRQYSWVDKIEKDSRKKIGFFAQEIEEVLPDAVGTTTGIVPTIYRQADAFTETTVTVKNHGITTEKKLEVVDPENGKTKIDIIKVIDGDILEVKFEKPVKDKLFVIGPEVDDSRLLNQDYLMAVSFGGLKELHELVKTQQKTIEALTSRLDALVEQLK